MALVQQTSLMGIGTLSKHFTLQCYNGLQIVRKKPGKMSRPRSPAVQRMNNRYRLALWYYYQLKQSVLDLYRAWASSTDYSHKDLFVSLFLKSWGTYGQPPIVVVDFTVSQLAGDYVYTFEFAPYREIDATGYGEQVYGISPYAYPVDVLSEDGYITGVPYDIVLGPVLHQAVRTYHYSPRNRVGCRKPPMPFWPVRYTLTSVSLDPEGVDVWLQSSDFKNVTGIYEPTADQCASSTWTALQGPGTPMPNPVTFTILNFSILERPWVPDFVGGGQFYDTHWILNVNPISEHWPWAESITFDFTWISADDLSPWSIVLTTDNTQHTLTPGETPVTITKPQQNKQPITFHLLNNQDGPPSPTQIGTLLQHMDTPITATVNFTEAWAARSFIYPDPPAGFDITALSKRSDGPDIVTPFATTPGP